MLAAKQSDGKSLREHLESIWKQTGHKPAELSNEYELPSAFSFCFEIFKDLASRRSNSGFGANPITYSEILAYKELLQIELDIWEVKIIIQLDEWLLEYLHKEEQKKAKK